jgi:hypothetical protein
MPGDPTMWRRCVMIYLPDGDATNERPADHSRRQFQGVSY